jgi:hypothetical protein
MTLINLYKTIGDNKCKYRMDWNKRNEKGIQKKVGWSEVFSPPSSMITLLYSTTSIVNIYLTLIYFHALTPFQQQWKGRRINGHQQNETEKKVRKTLSIVC